MSGSQQARSSSSWNWPSFDTNLRQRSGTLPGSFEHDTHESSIPHPTTQDGTKNEPESAGPSQPETQHTHAADFKTPRPRQCRICLEIVQPTIHIPSIPGLSFASRPSVTYESEDPSSGRLLRPCRCKGSSRYVHEACLQEWRHQDRGVRAKNYYECPTCHFKYRLVRLNWGAWVNNTVTQLIMTVAICAVVIFLLGFIADPIINLYQDPYGTIADLSWRSWTSAGRAERYAALYGDEDEDDGWLEHMLKGLASLGLLSFVKLIFLSPLNYLNLRHLGIGGNRNADANNGRDRLANLSWVVIIVGAATFLWGVFQGVRKFSRSTLGRASEIIMDVPLNGDDDEDELPAGYEEPRPS